MTRFDPVGRARVFTTAQQTVAAAARLLVATATLVVTMSIAAAQTPATPTLAAPEVLNATLWQQKAHEYAYAAEQTYAAATAQLGRARVRGNALIEGERTRRPASRQPAIVLDLDETVLDNAPYQAAVVAKTGAFEPKDWERWMAQAAATAVPGAKAFLLEAKRRGFAIFYVTNRECPLAIATDSYPHPACPAREHTLANLRTLGLPFADDSKALLMKHDRRDWVDGKSSRRAFIGAKHRVALLIGDDLGDFLPTADVRGLHDSVGAKQLVGEPAIVDGALYQAHRAHFGRDWFVLPNPGYGSWEVALGTRPACQEAVPPRRGDDCRVAAFAHKVAQLVAAQVGAPGVAPPLPPMSMGALGIATWNLEWLIDPAQHDALSAACVPGQPRSDQRAIPCPEPGRSPIPKRTAADFAALARYAQSLTVDVVALQEVDGPEVARRVFGDGWVVDCFVSRAHPQKTGFAIRRGVPYRCQPELAALDVDGQSRAGADVTLYPDTPRAVRVLSVHLKSGCFTERLDSARDACATFRQQVPVLEAWVDARAAEGVAFALAGDFNRRLEVDARYGAGLDEAAPLNLFAALDDGVPAGAKLVRATRDQPYVGCSGRDDYDQYIDHVLVGETLAKRATGQRFVRVTYSDDDVARVRLSDHCPLGVVLEGAR